MFNGVAPALKFKDKWKSVLLQNVSLFIFIFLCLCLKESEIQLGPRDRGDDPWVLLLGIHSYSDSRRVYILQTGCKQVTAQDNSSN